MPRERLMPVAEYDLMRHSVDIGLQDQTDPKRPEWVIRTAIDLPLRSVEEYATYLEQFAQGIRHVHNTEKETEMVQLIDKFNPGKDEFPIYKRTRPKNAHVLGFIHLPPNFIGVPLLATVNAGLSVADEQKDYCLVAVGLYAISAGISLGGSWDEEEMKTDFDEVVNFLGDNVDAKRHHNYHQFSQLFVAKQSSPVICVMARGNVRDTRADKSKIIVNKLDFRIAAL